jgi:hypothetical protein
MARTFKERHDFQTRTVNRQLQNRAVGTYPGKFRPDHPDSGITAFPNVRELLIVHTALAVFRKSLCFGAAFHIHHLVFLIIKQAPLTKPLTKTDIFHVFSNFFSF